MNDAGALPTFLIIGAQKSGTRWLRRNLGEHPEIFTAARELEFFNDRPSAALGLDGYRALFDGWSGQPFVGEATPGYMMWREDTAAIAERIHAHLPGVSLIALLRNPVDRIHSATLHHFQRGRLDPGVGVLDHVRGVAPEDDRMGIVSGSWYAASLRPYVERFGARLRVLLYDDMTADPRSVYRAAVAHVGADPGFVPANVDRVRYSNRRQEPASAAERGLRRPLSAGERAFLMGYVRDDIDELEELVGIDLDRWRLDA